MVPSPELIAELYPWLRLVHVGLASLSVTLFVLRALGALAGQRWPLTARLRYLAPAIDTMLLSAGASLWWLLQLNPFRDSWLGVKLLLVVLYIVFGSYALKRASTRWGKAVFLAAALMTVGAIIGIATSHSPQFLPMLASTH